ncbi:MAG: amino-acid N-acetyltransferase [Actinomycetota bacterium]
MATCCDRRCADFAAVIEIRSARADDVRSIRDLVRPLAGNTLTPKDAVAYYEALQQFRVAEDPEMPGRVIACGALHVMWEDLAEVRTLAVHPDFANRGLGGRLLEMLIDDARALGLCRIFCLTFEVGFFTSHGFSQIKGQAVEPDVYAELIRSYDEGVAEFLDLERVKPNTLGNARMLRTL